MIRSGYRIARLVRARTRSPEIDVDRSGIEHVVAQHLVATAAARRDPDARTRRPDDQVPTEVRAECRADQIVVRTEQGLDADQAYMLCSVAGDLRISEIVDAPNWVVSFYFPRIVFA